MSEHASGSAEWSHVRVSADPEPIITYRTALVTYEELLNKGRYVYPCNQDRKNGD